MLEEEYFVVLAQCPVAYVVIRYFTNVIESSHTKDALVILAADIIALTLVAQEYQQQK